MGSSPYSGLPPSRFWKTGVSEQHPFAPQDLYRKKFDITSSMKVATAGSCFAQHIARHLKAHGFPIIDTEPAPPGLSDKTAQLYGYRLYSARYGNIYVTRQLLQLAREAYGLFSPHDMVWERKGRYFDALRPSVEPEGLDSPEQVRAHRANHLGHVRRVLETADLFVFTMGLTESWIHKPSGTVYPTAPGTLAGSFDPEVYAFKNFSFNEVLNDLLEFRELIRSKNPSVKFLLTVSPVPLTATASQAHVLVATIYSKSVLRAVAGELYSQFDDIDYFPSYEMIASHFSRGIFYEGNLRSIAPAGVETVMKTFLKEHLPASGKRVPTAPVPAEAEARPAQPASRSREDEICEEKLLEAFA